jgi:hypothetical protein
MSLKNLIDEMRGAQEVPDDDQEELESLPEGRGALSHEQYRSMVVKALAKAGHRLLEASKVLDAADIDV